MGIRAFYIILLWFRWPPSSLADSEIQDPAEPCKVYSSTDRIWTFLPAVISTRILTDIWALNLLIGSQTTTASVCLHITRAEKQINISVTNSTGGHDGYKSMSLPVELFSDHQTLELFISVKEELEIRILNHELEVITQPLSKRNESQLLYVQREFGTTNITFDCAGGCQTKIGNMKGNISPSVDYHFAFYSLDGIVFMHGNVNTSCINNHILREWSKSYSVHSNTWNNLYIKYNSTGGGTQLVLNENNFRRQPDKDCQFVGAEFEVSDVALWTQDCVPEISLKKKDKEFPVIAVTLGIVSICAIAFFVIILYTRQIILKKQVFGLNDEQELRNITSRTRNANQNQELNSHGRLPLQQNDGDTLADIGARVNIQEFTVSFNNNDAHQVTDLSYDSFNSFDSSFNDYEFQDDQTTRTDGREQTGDSRGRVCYGEGAPLQYTERSQRVSHTSLNSLYVAGDAYTSQDCHRTLAESYIDGNDWNERSGI